MIKTENIHKSFKTQRILNGISFTLNRSQTVVIIGNSGCGKTTFLRILAGLDKPDKGMVLIGKDVYSTPDFAMHPSIRKIGFVFQEPALWPHMKVRQNIYFGMKPENKRDERFFLELINKIQHKYPAQLSFGEQRRVAVVRALSSNPEYIFLDEAMVNLDKKNQRLLVETVRTFQNELRAGLLIVSHQPELWDTFEGPRFELKNGLLHETKIL